MKDAGTFRVTTPTDREILLTRTFDAPRETVFEAWTKAEHVRHWWDPSGFPLSVCEIDLRPNGVFRWVNSAHGAEHTFTGIYREIAAPERLVFTVKMFPSRPDPTGPTRAGRIARPDLVSRRGKSGAHLRTTEISGKGAICP